MMKRGGNYSYRLGEIGPAYLIHRGASQGGKKLDAASRQNFWQKRSRPFPEGVSISGNGAVVISATEEGLAMMSDKSLVIVVDPSSPRIWTPKRIKRDGEKVHSL